MNALPQSPAGAGWLIALAEAVRCGAVALTDALREAARPEHLHDAVAGLEAALAALPNAQAPLPELAVAAGTMCATAGQPESGERLITAGLRAAGPNADGETFLRGRVERLAVLSGSGRAEEAIPETDSLLPLVEFHPDGLLLGRCLLVRGRALKALGRRAEAATVLRQAIDMFMTRVRDERRLGLCHLELAQLHRLDRDWDGATTSINEAVPLLERAGEQSTLAFALQQRAWILCRDDFIEPVWRTSEGVRDIAQEWERAGDEVARSKAIPEALACLSRAADLVRGRPELEPLFADTVMDRALLLAGRGRIDEADACATEAVEVFLRRNERELAATRRACQGEWLEAVSRFAEAAERFADADRLLADSTDAENRASILRPLGQTADAAGLFARARDAFRRADLLDPHPAPSLPDALQRLEDDADAGLYASVENLAGHVLEHSLPDGGHPAVARLLALARARMDSLSVGVAVSAIGRAAEFLEAGQAAAAVAVLDDAIPVLAAAGCACPRGTAHRLRARARRALGDRVGALDDLGAAVEAFTRGRAWFARVEARVERMNLFWYLARFEEQAEEFEAIRPDLDDTSVWAVARLAARRLCGERTEQVDDPDENPLATHQAEAEAWVARVFAGPQEDDSFYFPLMIGYASLLRARRTGDRISLFGSLFGLLDMLTDVGRFKEALEAAAELASLVTADDPPWVRAFWDLHRGIAEVQAGRYAQGMVTLEAALPNLPDNDNPHAHRGLLSLGLAYQNLGQFESALACYSHAIERLDELEHRLAERLAAAPDTFQETMRLAPARKLHGLIVRFGSNARLNAGLLFHQIKDYEAADRFFRATLARLDADATVDRATLLMNLALVKWPLGQLAEAAALLSDALAAYEKAGVGVKTQICRMNLGQLSHLQGDSARAVELYTGIDPNLFSHGERASYHLGYGVVLGAAGRVPEALDHLRRSGAAHRAAVREAGASELSLEYFGRRNNSFAAGPAVLALDHGDAPLAFELAQPGKGLLAQEFLVGGAPPRLDSEPILAARARLVAALDRGNAPDSERERQLALAQYLTLNRAATLRPADGSSLLEAEPGSTIDAVRRALAPGWVLLDFLRADDDDLRVFVVTRDRVRVETLDLARGGETFRDRLRLLMSQLENVARRPVGWTPDADRVWDDLHEFLFRPLEKYLAGCTGLYLVPHGYWHAVPLHAARTWDESTAEYVYLQDRFPVAYLPSAAALPHLPAPVPRVGRCHSLANPERGTDRTLPFADWEAAQLAARFPGGAYFSGPDATAARADGWGEADLIHFGCHGTGDETFAGLSRLYLAGGDRLLAHDVLYRRDALRSGAAVVLNGCQTGVKDWRGVDESLGLMTAFLLRGAGVVLATQWNIADHFAARAVVGFAEALAAGRSPPDAIRSGLRAARAMTPTQLATDCDALLTRFPADRFPKEAERIRMTRPSTSPGATRNVVPVPVTRDVGPGYDDPLFWAAFQLVGRMV